MRVAFLGPITKKVLKPYLPNLTSKDLQAAPGEGGSALVNLVLPRIINKQETIIITLDDNLSTPIKRSHKFLTLYILPRRRRGLFIDLYNLEKKYIREAIANCKPDLIHAHWTYEYALAALGRNIHYPVLVTVHDNTFDILKYSSKLYILNFFITHFVFKRSSYTTVVSPNVYNVVVKYNHNKVWLVENIMLSQTKKPKFEKLRSASNRDIIISSTSWNKLKNPKPLLIAFSLLKNLSDLELHLCGKGMEPNGPAQIWAKKKNLAKNVYFHGLMENKEYIELLKHSKLYIHTSRTEACSMSIAEAMINKVVVIGGRNSGGVPWQLEYGKIGVLTNIDSSSILSRDILLLLSDNNLRLKLINEAYKSAVVRYNLHRILLEYENIYNYIISNNLS